MLFAGDFRLSLPFILQVAPSPFGPVGYCGGVLWCLETILGHIHDFCTHVNAYMFVREPYHVPTKTIGYVTDYNRT